VGNAGGAAMHDVSGTSGAAPIWADVMGWLHRGTPSSAPRPPGGVVRQAVRYGPAPDGGRLESARGEWFLRGTQQALFAIDTVASSAYQEGAGGQKGLKPAARILAPAPGTIVALDPDIPPAHQRLRFEADGAAVRWRIDGKPAGQGAQWAWLPWPGRHRVELLDARGKVLDTIQIEVRGAGVRTPE
jgi:penicillin-binding protein 1C